LVRCKPLERRASLVWIHHGRRGGPGNILRGGTGAHRRAHISHSPERGRKAMKWNALFLIVLLASGWIYMDYSDGKISTSNELKSDQSTDLDMPAPDFSFTDIDGKTHKLSDYRGKTIVLNFWATWCAPCVVELPQMLKLAEKTFGKAVFIFLSLDESEADIEKFFKKYALKYEQGNILIGIDKDKKISQSLFQTYKLPETFLIDPKGRVREKIIGFNNTWNQPKTIEKIKNITAGTLPGQALE
jgi:thiol-disulfide isomerase/thioredoxin